MNVFEVWNKISEFLKMIISFIQNIIDLISFAIDIIPEPFKSILSICLPVLSIIILYKIIK